MKNLTTMSPLSRAVLAADAATDWLLARDRRSGLRQWPALIVEARMNTAAYWASLTPHERAVVLSRRSFGLPDQSEEEET